MFKFRAIRKRDLALVVVVLTVLYGSLASLKVTNSSKACYCNNNDLGDSQ